MSLVIADSGDGAAPTDKAARDAGASWPNFRNGLELRGVTKSPLPDKLELLWSHPIPDGMVFTSAVAVLDGRVYASTLGGELLCLDLKSGKLLWKYLSAAKPEPDTFIPGFPSAPTVAADSVYVGDEDGVFHAVDRKTGKKRWLFQTQAEIN
ncbi:MAG: serine/threonine protein kinase, partial [Planctomycetaceae bacterium]|nr:serine/threonine protein kinase [Planctomycetaceae bacterium]